MTFQRWCLLLASAVFAIVAWFGVGYHSEDEFQHVILIAEHLRGHVDADAMPLDFQERWRSMLLPVTAAGLFESAGVVGISDPFTLTLLLRLLTAVLALTTLRGLSRVVKPMLREENRRAMDVLPWFLWFVPVLLVRFTGEVWSALFFTRGLIMLLDEKPRSPWGIGAWWGAAVVLRPAAALLPLGAWLWVVVVRRTPRAYSTRMIGGGACAILASACLDSLCYGEATSSLREYLRAALSGQENARFTALPWYQYALFGLKYATLPIGALMAAALCILLALNRKHPLLWLVIPFVAVHSLIPVKELRFLFPLAPLMPWLLLAAWDALCARWPDVMQRDVWMRLLFPFAAFNALALLIAASTPAGNGRIRLAQTVARLHGDHPVHVDHLGDWRQRIPPFYLAAGSTEDFVDRVVPSKEKSPHLVVARESLGLDRVESLRRMAVATPPWTHRFLGWYGLEDGYDPLVLYQLTTENIGH